MSVFWRVLGAFLLAMVTTVAIVIFVSFRFVAEREALVASLDREAVTATISEVVATDGAAGFRQWLKRQEILPLGETIYLVDSQGVDILARPLPREVSLLLRRVRRGARIHRAPRHPVIELPDGRRWAMLIGPVRPPALGLLAIPSVHRNILFLSLAATLLICLLLSRYLTAPIRRMTETAEHLAAGDLTARAGPLAHRTDEIGTLARQFDTMADTLQSALARRDALLRHISHELRSPLTRIELALELAERQPERVSEHLARIADESAAIESLTEQALTMIRSGDRQAPDRVRLNLIELCQHVIDNAAFEAAPSGVRIELHHEATQLEVAADPTLLASAIENVIRNALRYAPPETTIDVDIAVEARAVSIEVRDRGPGVSPSRLPHLFDPFYSTEAGHHGLGLALTAQAMQAHGGTARARNHPDGGLQVCLTLPRE